MTVFDKVELHGFRLPTRSGLPPLLPVLLLIGIVVVLLLTAPLVEAKPLLFWDGVRAVFVYLKNYLLIPDGSFLPSLLAKLGETLEIALLSTALAVFLSLPLGFLAARNGAPNIIVFQISRGVLSLLRSVPDVVVALAFVSAVGLGALSGVLALALATVGFMARFFADAIEVTDTKAVEGTSATGASRMQVRLYALLPQSAPDLVATTMYALDGGLRSATILGIVGAGGVGYDLQQSLRLFQYDRVVLIVIGIYLAVALTDRLSTIIRAKVR